MNDQKQIYSERDIKEKKNKNLVIGVWKKGQRLKFVAI